MIPTQLQIRGIKFVLLERGGKKPFQNEWQNKVIEFDSQELKKNIEVGWNYGVMGGGSKQLIVIDFDNVKVQDEICKKLPQTFTVQTGSGKLHKYFFSDGTQSFKIFDEDMNTLADVQGEGKQVVGPNSIHPNGNKYRVIDNSEIVFLPYAEIKALLMPYDKKPKKDKQEFEKPKVDIEDNFLEKLKATISMQDVLASFGIEIKNNPTACLFHTSKGGKCLGFNKELAHCFHCDGAWNIFSFVKDAKKCDFKEALEYLSNLAGLQDEYEISKRRFIENLRATQTNKEKEIRSEYIELVSAKPKEWGRASELLVDWIKEKSYLYTIKDDLKTEIWVYENGIYIPNGKSYIKENLRKLLLSFYTEYISNLVIAKIEADTFIDMNTFFNQIIVDEIPVQNGILNIFTRELKPFSPEKIFFNKLPVEYDSRAECPQIEKFIGEVLSKADDKEVFYELGGFCLLKDYRHEKAFMLLGNGRNGKDKTLELIKRLIGVENCCSVPLSSIRPESFIISEFHNKMVNLSGEINNQDLKDTSTFKALTGRSFQSAPRKFLRPVHFVNHAKFIFACNELPFVYDNSKGFWDRWILLEFPYTFVPKEDIEQTKDKTNLKLRDENIIDKITTPQELSGLLNKFLNGLDRLTFNKRFSSTQGSEEIKQCWIRKSNSCTAFCLNQIEEDYNSYISRKEFRKKYSDYCKQHKVAAKSDFVIKRTLEELYGSTEENKDVFGKWERVWGGIKWKL